MLLSISLVMGLQLAVTTPARPLTEVLPVPHTQAGVYHGRSINQPTSARRPIRLTYTRDFSQQSQAGFVYSERVSNGMSNRLAGFDVRHVFGKLYYGQLQFADSTTRTGRMRYRDFFQGNSLLESRASLSSTIGCSRIARVPERCFFLGYGGSMTESEPLAFNGLRRVSDGVFLKASWLCTRNTGAGGS